MRSVIEAVSRRARRSPGEIAVTDGTAAISYRMLRRTYEELAAKLAVRYAGSGAIGLCLDNSPVWVALDLALIQIGRPVVVLPTFFTDAQRQHALAQTGAEILITDRPISGFPHFGTLAILGAELFLYDTGLSAIDLPAGTAKVTFTSGTSGQSKGVCLSQHGMETVANALIDTIGADFADIHCAVLQLAVLLENVAGLYPTLIAGGRYHVPPQARIGFAMPFRPDYRLLAQALQGCRATSTILVPEILKGLIGALAADFTTLPEMRLLAVGGANVAEDLLVRAAAIGLPVFQGYGLTEMGSVVALNTPDSNRRGSVGRPLPHIRVDIAADGEILLRPPAFLGYVGDMSAPACLSTGDIGRLDETGHLHISGRKSNVLITSFGRNVAPEWVESELLCEPAIGQAIAFGNDRPALGALIVPSSAALKDADIGSAIDAANARLPEYARIRHWAMVPPFTPANQQMTANGRLRRHVIHEHYRDLMARCLRTPGQYLSFFEILVRATAGERAELLGTPQIRDGLKGQIALSSYIDYLTEAFHHVKHTVSLMRAAHEKLPPEKGPLREALRDYIGEETGHEAWILEDIGHAGGDPGSVRDGRPRLATEMMVAYAYYYVEHVNPVGLFGMIFVLEGTSIQLASQGAGALMRTLGLGENCFRYLTSHGALDIDHMRFFRTLVDRIDAPDDRAAIIHMAKTMFVLFANLFRSIPHTPADAYVH